jgi:hypothetical protein
MPDHAAFRVPPGQRQLFLDDYGVEALDGLARTMHRPAKRGAVIRPDLSMGIDSLQIRTAPLWDPARGAYRLWDLSSPAEVRAAGVNCGGYHESADGLHWRQPVVGQVEHRGSRENHFVSVTVDGKRCCVSTVAPAPGGQGFVGLSYASRGALVSVASADGFDWHALGEPAITSADEFNLSYDPAAGEYLLTVKLQEPPLGRQVALLTSRDFRNWDDYGVVFHADEEDQRRGRERIEARLADPTLLPLLYNNPND